MDHEKLDSIIRFAIDREQEAVNFYQELQTKTKFSGKKEFLNSLEMMEKGHIEILRHIQRQTVSQLDIPAVANMKISDYLVPAQSEGEMSYQDIIITAMKREEASYKLYSMLAGNFQDADTRKLFEKLASEEAQHKSRFEEIYDQEILKEN
ncbi:MAG: ferritin family protein [Candidatus Delongbacteria bacterium]|nr:ferritin family protein [Candidatus Delongbacteria bacterium]